MAEMIEAAAKAQWEHYANSPLHVGKFKEPMDYREWRDLGKPARRELQGHVAAGLIAFLEAIPGEVMREAILGARSGDGQELLRADMQWCAPAASAGLIGASIVAALKARLTQTEGT